MGSKMGKIPESFKELFLNTVLEGLKMGKIPENFKELFLNTVLEKLENFFGLQIS